ncbi:MAG: transketolase [Candidatus Nanopelagicales bacterium]|nr:transketolase [Candidatus Nanopelagicales bacterium]
MTDWTELDDRAVAAARALAADAVQRAGNGHPGTAMALAPAAYLLFQRFLRHDPADPTWIGRDRFILSCGHSSLTLYTQLFLSGYPISLEDLQAFRTLNSLTPGHPEHNPARGIEMTTGPLGQGIASAVGIAMAQRFTRGLLDPEAPPGTSPFDATVWVIASDGDLEEGISAEAASLAGLQELANLVVIWDDNRISIEGDTAVAFTEDVAGRFRAHGWRTLFVDLAADGSVDVSALGVALTEARAEAARPTLVQLRSVIAWPAPKARNTGKSHGAALGADEVAATKVALGLDPEASFAVPDDVLAHTRRVGERGAAARAAWQVAYERWRAGNPERAALLDRLVEGSLPEGWRDVLPTWEPGSAVATRKASDKVINALAGVLPELWGGSADLGESNGTTIAGGGDFLPADSPVPGATPYGRVLHFGVREHAMGAILNGIALHGLTRAFGGTFLVFSDYMRAPVRLAALMTLPTTFVWTHDSVGVGEDGPTHQPVEHLWSLRAIPGLAVVRPADAAETAQVWAQVLEARRPTGLILTRQDVPVLDRTAGRPAHEARRGAYVVAEASAPPQVLLLATGSEVQLALGARTLLEAEGVPTRVVSMPCLEWFAEQPAEYREAVLPPHVRARVSVEAGSAQGWWQYVGSDGACVAIDHFGASADGAVLFEQLGFTAERVAQEARDVLARLA